MNQIAQHAKDYRTEVANAEMLRAGIGERAGKVGEFADPDSKVVVLLGATGAGKSLFGSLLAGNTNEPLFPVSDKVDSCTLQTKQVPVSWLADAPQAAREFAAASSRDAIGHKKLAVLVDTPGMNDTGGRDTQHIADMVKTIRSVDKHYKGVNRFLIILNGEDARFCTMLQDILTTFEMTFTGEDHPVHEWVKHASFVFTRWSMHPFESRKRWMNRGHASEEAMQQQRKAEFSRKLSEHLQLREPIDIDCYFIDSIEAGDCLPTGKGIYQDDIDDKMKEFYFGQLAELRHSIETSLKFPCSDMTAVQCMKDAWATELAKEKEKAAWNNAKWPLLFGGGGVATYIGTYLAMHEPVTCMTLTGAGLYSLTKSKPRKLARNGVRKAAEVHNTCMEPACMSFVGGVADATGGKGIQKKQRKHKL